MILMLGCCFQAYAAVIVDTGPGPNAGGGYGLYPDQWLAGEFNLSQPDTITDVYGWIDGTSYDPGTATIAIYDDGGIIPGSQLFTTQFSIFHPQDSEIRADWYGASGLNWGLSSGTYWVSFESRANDTYSGAMPFYSQNPLSNEAFWNGGSWNSTRLGIGVRVYSDGSAPAPGVVPEPASMILMGIGLAGAAMRKRKRA